MRRGGFTLIELLVVMAIILVLVGLLMAAMNIARNFARDTRVKALLTMVDEGIGLYYEEFEAYPVAAADGTNHLAWQLCHPDPSFRKDWAGVEAMRATTGFPTRLLVDAIPPERYAQGTVDFENDNPIPIYDGLEMNGPHGSPLIYIHDPAGRLTAEEAGGEPESHSAFTHAFEGFEYGYELWSVGEDGIYDEALHDTSLPANKDNLTVTRYR